MIEEILDLVNEHDDVIDQKPRSEVYKNKLNNFRVINAFLVNSKKEIWIPRRSPLKKLFPLCLDASVGGHVESGESYQQAFLRELKEELNIDSSSVNYKMIAKLTPKTHAVSAYMNLYVIYSDLTPNYNKSDFIEANWWPISTIIKFIKNGEPTKGDLPILIDVISQII